MTVAETLTLFFLAFVVVPTAVETGVCHNPSPEKEGVICNWKEKTWEQKFNLGTREYYYIVKEDDSHNFIEKRMVRRYNRRVNGEVQGPKNR